MVLHDEQGGHGSGNPFLLAVPAISLDDVHHGTWQGFKRIRQGHTLHEFQLYAVEQWVVDRSRAIRKILTATNDPSHKVLVDIVTPRGDTFEERSAIWDRMLQKARADGARLKQTHLGAVLAVSLLSFRSDLSLVLVPNGDYEASKSALYTNINLRRLGHGGRSGLNLSEPSASQQERFLQVYRLPSLGSGSGGSSGAAAAAAAGGQGSADSPKGKDREKEKAAGARDAGPGFSTAVLGLIRLVQAALALSNLGPLKDDPRGLIMPDGLLCNATVEGLSEWQLGVAEPLLQTELGESILSPAALTALLTMVIALRNRLATLGIHHLPNDPFTDRGALLTAYQTYMRALRYSSRDAQYVTMTGLQAIRSQYHKATKDSLRRAIRHRIDDIRGAGTEQRGGASAAGGGGVFEEESTDIHLFAGAVQAHSGDLKSVTRLWKGKYAKKDRFEFAYGNALASGLPGSAAASTTTAQRKGSNGLSDAVSSSAAPYHGSLDGRRGSLHEDDMLLSPVAGAGQANEESSSENEAGLGTKLFRGVSRRTKKIGDGVSGLLDKTGARTQGGHVGRDDTLKSRQMSQLMPTKEEEDYARHRTYLSPDPYAHHASISGRFSPLSHSHASVANSTVALASLDEDAESMLAVPRMAPHMRRAATDTQIPTLDTANADDYESASAGPADGSGLIDGTGKEGKEATSRRKRLDRMREKRHSFSCARDRPAIERILQPRRMKLDVDIHYDYYQLRRKEEKLAQLVEALDTIDKAYDEALLHLTPALKRRQQEVTALSARAKGLSHAIELFTSDSSGPAAVQSSGAGDVRGARRQASTGSGSGSAVGLSSLVSPGGHEDGIEGGGREAVVSLAIGTERLSYAQTVLEEKLGEVDDFRKTLLLRIGGSEALLSPPRTQSASRVAAGKDKGKDKDGPGRHDEAQQEQTGTIVVGLKGLLNSAGAGGGKGMRRLLDALGLWSTWLSYLKGRVGSYL